MTELLKRRKNVTPVLKRRPRPVLIRRLRPVLQRRARPVLQRRPKPDVYYCERKEIKNRLPYPIECSWIGTMHECCQKCTKKINYILWKEGGYIAIAQELEARTYKSKPIIKESPILQRRNNKIKETKTSRNPDEEKTKF